MCLKPHFSNCNSRAFDNIIERKGGAAVPFLEGMNRTFAMSNSLVEIACCVFWPRSFLFLFFIFFQSDLIFSIKYSVFSYLFNFLFLWLSNTSIKLCKSKVFCGLGFSFFLVLGTDRRTLNMAGKCATELHPPLFEPRD